MGVKKSFVPRNRAGVRAKLQNLAAKATAGSSHALKYNLTAAEIAAIAADARWYNYMYDYILAHDARNREFQRYFRQRAEGLADGEAAASMPAPLPLPTPIPADVPPGIVPRFSALGQGIKASINYAEADGIDLGLKAPDGAARDGDELKPIIIAKLTAAGQPELFWKKLGMGGIKIFGERADGSWEHIATDVYPPSWIDTRPLPKAGKSEVRRYKAVYFDKGGEAGLWSDIISVTVTGIV